MNAQDIVTGLMKRLDAAEARVKELEKAAAYDKVTIDRLRAFRDAVYAKMRAGAGNLTDPFAYIFQREWDAIKAAEEAGEKGK